MTAHSDHSASGMGIWDICAGSIALRKEVPRGDTKYSREGTVAHDLAERVLTGDLFTPSDALGAVVDGVKISQEMVDSVSTYIDFVDNLDPDLIGQTLYEETLALNKLDVPKEAKLFGTADALFFVDSNSALRIHVVDLKYGKGVPVDVIDNKQLLYYGLGAVYLAMGRKKKLSTYLSKKRLELTMTIVQPRAEHKDGPVRSWTIDGPRLLEFEEYLTKAVKYSLDNPDDYVAGTHCRFCPAKEVCPELNRAEQEVLVEIDYLKLQSNPKDLSPEEFAEALASCDVLEDAIKRHRKYAVKLLESGSKIPGWQMTPTRATRRWSDESQLRHHLEGLSLDPQRMASLSSLSPTQLENVLSEDDWKRVQHLVVNESNGTRLSFTGPSNEDALKLLM